MFTGKDVLDAEKQDFGEFLRHGTHPMIEEVLAKCGNRCVAFNNKAGGEENCNQVKMLVECIDDMVARNNETFFSAENFGKASQRLRRHVVSGVSRARRRVGFNMGMVPILIKLMAFLFLISTVISLWTLLRLFSYPNLLDLEVVPEQNNDILENNPDPPIENNSPSPTRLSALEMCRESSEADSRTWKTHSCIFVRVILTAVDRGFTLPDERNTCLRHSLSAVLPSARPRIQNYVYVRVMYNAIGRCKCLRNEEHRCVPRCLRAAKRRKTGLSRNAVYRRILLCAVGRGWSLANEEADNWNVSRFRFVARVHVSGAFGGIRSTIGEGIQTVLSFIGF